MAGDYEKGFRAGTAGQGLDPNASGEAKQGYWSGRACWDAARRAQAESEARVGAAWDKMFRDLREHHSRDQVHPRSASHPVTSPYPSAPTAPTSTPVYRYEAPTVGDWIRGVIAAPFWWLWELACMPLRWLWALVRLAGRAIYGLVKLALALAAIALAIAVVVAVDRASRTANRPGAPAVAPPSEPGALEPAGTTARVAPARSEPSRAQHVCAELGLVLEELGAEDALDLPPGDGAYVQDVIAESPAADADIRPGDIVLWIAGRRVHGLDQIPTFDLTLRSGGSLTITLVRAGVQYTPRLMSYEERMRRRARR